MAVFRDISTTCRSPLPQPPLDIELGVMGIGYDDDVLPVGDWGGGGDEQDDMDDDDEAEDEDDESESETAVLSVSGADGERSVAVVVVVVVAPAAVGWMELSR